MNLKYPLDLYGTSVTNHISNEQHTLESGDNRILIPHYPPFYTESLIVKDADTDEELVPYDQFYAVIYYEEPSIKSGKEVCSAIVVVDNEVSNNIVLEYQAVGGDYQNIGHSLDELIANLDIDDREVAWGDLLGKPELFEPAPHLHPIRDFYGFEYLTVRLEEIKAAILHGDLAKYNMYMETLEDRYEIMVNKLRRHAISNDHDDRYVNKNGDVVFGRMRFNKRVRFEDKVVLQSDGRIEGGLTAVQDALFKANVHANTISVTDDVTTRTNLDVPSVGESRGFSVAMGVAL